MSRRTGSGSGRRRLGVLLGLFFVALAIPSAVLTWQAYTRLQWEAFHQYQLLAGELLGQIDRRLSDRLAKEEARTFGDYQFLVPGGPPAANVVQRSPLSRLPVDSDIPGLLGHFQVDALGRFTTPLLPEDAAAAALAYGIDDRELQQRRALRERLLQLLSQPTGLADASPPSRAGAAAPSVSAAAPGTIAHKGRRRADDVTPQAESLVRDQARGQAAFDRLSERRPPPPAPRQQAAPGNLGRVTELKLEQAFANGAAREAAGPIPAERPEQRAAADRARRGRDVVAAEPAPAVATALVRLFQSELEPFEFAAMGPEHFVLYRKAWRAGARYIQGAVIERDGLLHGLFERPFRDAAVAGVSRLGIAFDGDLLAALGGRAAEGYLARAEDLSGMLLHRGRLSAPLDRMELIFSVTRLPIGSAGALLAWVALTLGLVLSGGLLLLYRLGVRQIDLNRQQRDFVSAVSHELKTPLTSIRMYSEMLREGWADDARRRDYYAFIHDESERLSRLINNVLQLARMSRDELAVEPRSLGVASLLDLARSKLDTLVEQRGFALHQDCDAKTLASAVRVDADAFVQILINLVDNAIKFSAGSDRQVVELSCHLTDRGLVEFGVRDYGPGIPRDQMKKIFRLFYRSESELTRETVGTGIGLALVHRLTTAMGGEVEVVNRDPGAEFRVRLPRPQEGPAAA